MACEDIENRLSDLRSQKQTVETNLANCLEASVTEVIMETIG
jgi:hypothetical protein